MPMVRRLVSLARALLLPPTDYLSNLMKELRRLQQAPLPAADDEDYYVDVGERVGEIYIYIDVH